MMAGALDEVRKTAPAKLANRHVGGDAPSTAGPLRIPLNLIARVAFVHHVAGAMRHGVTMRCRVSDERIAAVIRHVQPLVTVCRPGVSEIDPLDQVAVFRSRGRPESESTINVH